MRKTLYTYLLREQVPSIVLCLVGVSFVLITGQLFQLMRILFSSKASFGDLSQIVLFALPKLALFAGPMATLLGVMLAFVRLNGDNELIAFRAAGTSFFEFLPPIVGVLALVTLLSFGNAIYVIPAANTAFDVKITSLARASIPVLLKEGVFVSTIPKLVFFFKSVDHSDMTIRGVFVQDQRHPTEKVTITAEGARLVIPPDSRSITFRINNGVITRIDEKMREAQAVTFKSYDFSISMDELMGVVERGAKSRVEMTFGELWENMKTVRERKLFVYYALEFHQRTAFSFACLILGLLGPPLGSLFRRTNRMTGITIGVGIFLAYYVILTAGRGLSDNGVIPPFLAAWLPNLLCIVLVVYLWWKMQSETPFVLMGLTRLGPPLRRLFSRFSERGTHR
ncbi:MAG: LptF/LptG family permease [Syntrophobacteraceae bacterium]